MKNVVILVAVSLALCGQMADGYTPAESNAVVRAILQRSLYYSSLYHTVRENVENIDIDAIPTTWNGFLRDRDASGWPLEAKEAAFNDYLANLGSRDCRSADSLEQSEMFTAINSCGNFYRTNTVPYLKRIALNPKGVYRQLAIGTAIDFSPVDDEMTRFVETIVTNTTGYGRSQRGAAWTHYSQQIQKAVAAAASVPPACSRAAEMYYRNRTFGICGAMGIDKALLACCSGYASSSNRLQMATLFIDHEDCNSYYPRTRNYFIAITNQLLSSGQQLRQLNIGEAGE